MDADVLSAAGIRARMPRIARERLGPLWVLESVDSTNRLLRDEALQGAPTGSACLAETQTAGYGRRGRRWSSPPGGNLSMSLLWRFDSGTASLGGLALCAGVASVRALARLGLGEVGIKWPNDLCWQGGKLAGILVEAGGDREGPCFAVIGMGLNLHLERRQRGLIDQPVADLHDIAGSAPPRNALAAEILTQWCAMAGEFAASGFGAFAPDYGRLDILRERPVQVADGDRVVAGVGAGVDSRGAFRLRTAQGVQTYGSGEVSVRAV